MKRTTKIYINKNNRRKNKKNKRRGKKVYSLSTLPQRYGPGSNVSVINVGKAVDSSSFARFSLQSLLEENDEFSKKKGLYKFFKIKEIRAVFLPANVAGSFSLGALNMSWNLTSISTSELLKDDSTKYFPIYRTRNYVFRYLPPRTVLDVQSIAPSPPNKFFDFSQFLNCDTVVNFPGWLYVWNPSNVILHLDFQAVVRFRGNDFHSAPSKTIFEPDMFKDKMFLCDPQGNTLSVKVVQKEDKKEEEEEKDSPNLEIDEKEEFEEESISIGSYKELGDEKDIKLQGIANTQRKRQSHLMENLPKNPLIEKPTINQELVNIKIKEKMQDNFEENDKNEKEINAFDEYFQKLKIQDKENVVKLLEKKKKSKSKKKIKIEPEIQIQKISDLIEEKNKKNINHTKIEEKDVDGNFKES